MARPPVVSRIAHGGSTRRAKKRQARWWETLDPEFYRFREPFELEEKDRLRVSGTAAADHVMRTLAACLLTATVVPTSFSAKRRLEQEPDRHFYESLAISGDARRFFQTPPSGVLVSTRRTGLLSRFLPGLPAESATDDVVFESPFVPVNPRQRDEYLGASANRTVHSRWWRHREGGRPVVLVLHGFAADLYAMNEWLLALPAFYALGCDLLLMTLPFHGTRRGPGEPFSGYGFFAGGPSRINEAVAQAVQDARVLVRWLREERGAPAVGVTGVSLGGLVAAQLAATEPKLAFAVPNVPVTTLADLVMEWEPMGTVLRRLARKGGWSLVEARQHLAPSSPLTWNPVLPKDRLFVIGGAGDRLAPPKHARLLWEHWRRPRLHWFPGSHLLHFDRGRYLEEMARFLVDLGFLRVTGTRDRSRPRSRSR